MEYRSTLIRNVEIPSTLPSMDTLTDLRGSIILKEVTPKENAVTIEGDLLWRGYFAEGGDECLWEGAEYFSETIPHEELRCADPSLIDPQILSLTGSPVSDTTYRLSFDIRWYESATADHSENSESIVEETASPIQKEASAQPPRPCSCHGAEPLPKTKTDLEENLERIDETWRETLKSINEPRESMKAARKEEAPSAKADTEREAEAGDEVEIKCCPYSKFCLRYYRTQDGDELERIAERFSATIAKLKEYNKLDSSALSSGQMLRIP